MKRVSLVAIAAVPGLIGGGFALAGPAAGAIIPARADRVHPPRPPRVHPDSNAVCVTSLPRDNCTFVHGTSVNVKSVGVYDWTKAGTGYIGYNSLAHTIDSKWRAHAFAHSADLKYHYSWTGIHCSFPAGTHIYGWANYDKITKPYIAIEGNHFTDLHDCV
jgi:hypothetical protein